MRENHAMQHYTRKTFFRERMERYARINDSEREEKGTGSVAGKRCALQFSKLAAEIQQNGGGAAIFFFEIFLGF